MNWLKLFFAVLISTYVWISWKAWDKVEQKNSDFIIYYTAARMVNDGKGKDLYDLEIQKSYQRESLTAIQFKDNLLPYNHPPFEIVWFLPLSRFPYLIAFLLWDLISLLCLGAGLYVLATALGMTSRPHTEILLLGSLAFLPVLVVLLQGQDSALAILFWCLAFKSLKESREWRAGLSLSLALVKFQILPVLLILLAVKRRWRALTGFLFGVGVILLISLTITGIQGMKKYLLLLRETTRWVNHYGVVPSQMQCWRGQIHSLLGSRHLLWAEVLTVIMGLILLTLVLYTWKGSWDPGETSFGLKFALVMIVSLLTSPHLNFHDLSLLLVPGFLTYAAVIKGKSADRWHRLLAPILFVVAYPGTLLTLVVSLFLPIQVAVWCLMVWVLVLANNIRKDSISLPKVVDLPA